MTAQLITSGQQKILERVVQDATVRACRELGLTKDSAQRVLGRGDELSLGIKKLVDGLAINQSLIQIDRSKLVLINKDEIKRQDRRSLSLEVVDLTKVRFVFDGSDVTPWKEDLIDLDFQVMQSILESQSSIPQKWQKHGYIRFKGTVLRNCHGDYLYLVWNGRVWSWDMGNYYRGTYPSACLPK